MSRFFASMSIAASRERANIILEADSCRAQVNALLAQSPQCLNNEKKTTKSCTAKVHVELPPGVGTRVEALAEPYIDDEDQSPRWFGALVIESTAQHVVIKYDDQNYISHFAWPDDKDDLRIVNDKDTPCSKITNCVQKEVCSSPQVLVVSSPSERSEPIIVASDDDMDTPCSKITTCVQKEVASSPQVLNVSSPSERNPEPTTVASDEELLKTPPKKRRRKDKSLKKKLQMNRIPWSEQFATIKIRPREISHMIQFFLCQLRAQYAEIVKVGNKNEFMISKKNDDRCGDSRRCAYNEFDCELGRYDESVSIMTENSIPGQDVASCQVLMKQFLLGKSATGDKWMPWHAALGEHERYLLQVVYQLPLLESHRERYVMSYAFSGSRDIELFETLFKPLFSVTASDEDRTLGQNIIYQPDVAFAENGILHKRYMAYRANGKKKLHTTSYQCHPPQGASGANFVYYIVDRTRRFVHLGHQAFDTIEQFIFGTKQSSLENSNNIIPKNQSLECDAATGLRLWKSLQSVLTSAHEIGPTMSKIFLVSTHLAYPKIKILDQSCGIGDGADAAFDYLFEGLQTNSRKRHDQRIDLFNKLYTHLTQGPPSQDKRQIPRFLHMLKWTATHTRNRFELNILPEALAHFITPYDLQVALCEWRKFRSTVDINCLLDTCLVLSSTLTDSNTTPKGAALDILLPTSPAVENAGKSLDDDRAIIPPVLVRTTEPASSSASSSSTDVVCSKSNK
mmetsp:Transcript_1078/g.1556  ORF Transcript_1078/g.1556 Transcript_1078/m.1556 type:complete len:739 (-) Transcript_1078:168-2384(-)